MSQGTVQRYCEKCKKVTEKRVALVWLSGGITYVCEVKGCETSEYVPAKSVDRGN